MDNGLSWADQWDTAPDPPPASNGDDKKKDDKSGKNKLSSFVTKFFGKKSQK